MISLEVIKAEIDNVEDTNLELLYKIIKAMLPPGEVAERSPHHQNDAAFLLKMAGMFDSGPNDASENVSAIVAYFIQNKNQERPFDPLARR